MPQAPLAEMRVAQLIDANLDRAREGLRVIEDWCRFGIKREDLVITLKDWRQQLGSIHNDTYKKARSTETDQGIGLTHPAQGNRSSPKNIVAANCARVEEALRVLEEFARNPDPVLANTAAKIRYGLYDIEVKILEETDGSRRQKRLHLCRLCLITQPNKELISNVTKALEAGIGMVQYRSKNSNDLQRFSEAKQIAALCRDYEALFIINDRIDLALAVEADGVHLGQNDLPAAVARSLIGSERLLGKSTHQLKHIEMAEKEGVDYLGVGPVYPTTTKPESNPVGIGYVIEASKSTKLPWFAIGGIDNSNLKLVKAAGAERIAVASAIMNADDPSTKSFELLKGMA